MCWQGVDGSARIEWPLVPIGVCNPDRSPVEINRCDTAPTPTGLLSLSAMISQYFMLCRAWAPFRRTALVEPYGFSARRGGKFLEARILSERIEHRIEPEQRRSERHVFVQRAVARHREYLL